MYNNSSTISSSLYSPPTIPAFIDNNTDSYFSDYYHHHQKYRRPGLRSTVSELLPTITSNTITGAKPFYLDSMTCSKKSFYSLAPKNWIIIAPRIFVYEVLLWHDSLCPLCPLVLRQ